MEASRPRRVHRAVMVWSALAVVVLGACKRADEAAPAPTPSSVPLPSAALVEAPSPVVGSARSAPAPTPAGTAALPDESAGADAYVTAVDAIAVAQPPVSVECRGGEQKASLQRFLSGGSVVGARLAFSSAGHRSWSYALYYRGEQAVAIRHRITSWRFEGGPVDQPVTVDTVLERRYGFDSGKPKRCVEVRAEATTDRVESQVEAAPEAPIDCADAARILTLAAQARSSADDARWLSEACGARDPSSSAKLR